MLTVTPSQLCPEVKTSLICLWDQEHHWTYGYKPCLGGLLLLPSAKAFPGGKQAACNPTAEEPPAQEEMLESPLPVGQ